MRTSVTVIQCDVCGVKPTDEGAPDPASVREIFGVDVCDSCFAARAGESLDVLAKASRAAAARRALDVGASAQYLNFINNAQSKCR
jgi:hypothetical protein